MKARRIGLWSSVGGSRPAVSTGSGTPPCPPPTPTRYPYVAAEVRDDRGEPFPQRSIDRHDPSFLETKAAFERLIANTGGMA